MSCQFRTAAQALSNVAGSSRHGLRGYSTPLPKPLAYRRLSSHSKITRNLGDHFPLDVLCPSLTRQSTVASRARNLHTTSRVRNSAEPSHRLSEPPAHLGPLQRKAYSRLRPIVDSFSAPIDWAVAYGSGVVHQANAAADTPAPLTDFLLSTASPVAFHTENLRQNPGHYPIYARLMGSRGVAWVQERLGAGMWFVTMVKVNGIDIKYGIISTQDLTDDLTHWSALYLAGRLQKPVLPLLDPYSLRPALEANLRSALSVSLLLVPPNEAFTEISLWEQIAGISYSGDPRMSVPGAENPEKVRNIVRGEGVLEGFRRLYEKPLGEIRGLRWTSTTDEADGRWSWKDRGEGLETLSQPPTAEHYASLLFAFPLKLKKNIAKHFHPTLVDAIVDAKMGPKREDPHLRREDVQLEMDMWTRIAEEERLRDVVLLELRHIIRRPALTQSIKGLFTAGLAKSVRYSWAKFRKWRKGRQKSKSA